MVTSFAAVTNLLTVISQPSATFSCPSRNSHICLMRGGALSRVFPWRSQALGSETTTCLFLALNSTPSIPTVFRLQPHFFLSLLGPLALLVELVIVRSMLRNYRLAVKWPIIGLLSLISGLNFKCRARFDTSRQRTSSSAMRMSANS